MNRLVVDVPERLHRRVAAVARAQDCTRSEIVRECLRATIPSLERAVALDRDTNDSEEEETDLSPRRRFRTHFETSVIDDGGDEDEE